MSPWFMDSYDLLGCTLNEIHDEKSLRTIFILSKKNYFIQNFSTNLFSMY